VELPKGMNISDFVSQLGNGYFFKDFASKTVLIEFGPKKGKDEEKRMVILKRR
jgi:hypothetical protein